MLEIYHQLLISVWPIFCFIIICIGISPFFLLCNYVNRVGLEGKSSQVYILFGDRSFHSFSSSIISKAFSHFLSNPRLNLIDFTSIASVNRIYRAAYFILKIFFKKDKNVFFFLNGWILQKSRVKNSGT